ncbi:MAG: RagB/SusD family nutrient uptake outer membrane protein [Armatimonadota bacterium]
MRNQKLQYHARRGLLALTAGVVIVAACDVTNPGPVQDAFLNRPEAWPGLVNGMGRDLADALNWIAYTTAAVSREIHPSGSTGSYGITILEQQGELVYYENSTDWNLAQRARWVAEEGIRRLTGTDPYEAPETPPDPDLLAQAYLWAGYANRLLAENMYGNSAGCEVVIDGGAAVQGTEYFTRAESNFTSAMNTAQSSTIKLAAQAGRASIRVHTGDWTGAVADAQAVIAADPNFVYQMEYHDIGDDDQANRIYFSTAGEPYRAHTTWNTVYGDSTEAGPPGSYIQFEPNDPRVPRLVQPGEVGDAAIECCGKVPWWPQAKYANESADIDLSSAEEMQLIIAENYLRNDDIPNAMAILNQLRADAGLTTTWAPADINEAWQALMRERGIELWLEGRRLSDLRRWDAEGRSGLLDPLEAVGTGAFPWAPSHLRTRSFCYPIPESERETNPNLPLTP